jgi:hypothetical protein
MPWRKILALMLGLGGAVYFAQGTGLFTAYPSFMNNDIRWAAIGIVMVIVAVLIWPRGEAQK